MPDILKAEGSSIYKFDKERHWPVPLRVLVDDSKGTNKEIAVKVDETLLKNEGFEPPPP